MLHNIETYPLQLYDGKNEAFLLLSATISSTKPWKLVIFEKITFSNSLFDSKAYVLLEERLIDSSNSLVRRNSKPRRNDCWPLFS